MKSCTLSIFWDISWSGNNQLELKQQLPPLDKTYVSRFGAVPTILWYSWCRGSIPGAIYHCAGAADFHCRDPFLLTSISVKFGKAKENGRGFHVSRKKSKQPHFLCPAYLAHLMLCTYPHGHLNSWPQPGRSNSEVPKFEPEPLEMIYADPYAHQALSSDRKNKQVLF